MYVNAPYEKFMNIPDGISSKIMVCLAACSKYYSKCTSNIIQSIPCWVDFPH